MDISHITEASEGYGLPYLPLRDEPAGRRVCLTYVDSAGFCSSDCPHLHPMDLPAHVSTRAIQLRNGIKNAQGECRRSNKLIPQPLFVGEAMGARSLGLRSVISLMPQM